MKTSGLPCRATPDCETVITLASQDSMEALREAIGRRDAHEVEAHGYKHVPRDTSATPFGQTGSIRPRGRRRSEDLTAV